MVRDVTFVKKKIKNKFKNYYGSKRVGLLIRIRSITHNLFRMSVDGMNLSVRIFLSN